MALLVLSFLHWLAQAVDAFLKEMKLSLEDVKGRPSLTAAVVGYHGKPNWPELNPIGPWEVLWQRVACRHFLSQHALHTDAC
jgi:hypothetical protein